MELDGFLHRRNKTVFRLFDKNFDGYIDKKEFRWMTSSDRFSKKTIDIVFAVGNWCCIFQPTYFPYKTHTFQRCDLDGDGKLDYQEFKAMILRSKYRKEEIARKNGEIFPPPMKKQTTSKKGKKKRK